MRAPVLAVGDGTLGFWAAVRDVFPETRWQWDWVHTAGLNSQTSPVEVVCMNEAEAADTEEGSPPTRLGVRRHLGIRPPPGPRGGSWRPQQDDTASSIWGPGSHQLEEPVSDRDGEDIDIWASPRLVGDTVRTAVDEEL